MTSTNDTEAGGPMRCPFCGHGNSAVKDSRPTEDGGSIRRRRLCTAIGCGARFTTHERVTLRELVVLKRSGRRVPFDRDKLVRSLRIAVANRPIPPEVLDIGDLALVALKALDDVAYVRYASVYKVFETAADFAKFINEENLT